MSYLEFKAEFIRLLTEDSPHQDRRRADYNQAIFDPDTGREVFTSTSLDMVLDKFVKAARRVGLT